jgi:hypothetical protein
VEVSTTASGVSVRVFTGRSKSGVARVTDQAPDPAPPAAPRNPPKPLVQPLAPAVERVMD